MPFMARSKSLRDKLRKVESTGNTGTLIRIAHSSVNTLGSLGTLFLSGSDHIAMRVKYNQTVLWIGKWDKILTNRRYPTVTELCKNEEKIFGIIDNALEMAR